MTSGEVGEQAEHRARGAWSKEQKQVSFIDGPGFVDLVFDNLAEYDDEELQALGLRREVDLP